jgi:DNA modification methylase
MAKIVRGKTWVLINADYFQLDRLPRDFLIFKDLPFGEMKADFFFTDPPYSVSNVNTGTIKFQDREDMNKELGKWDSDVFDVSLFCNSIKDYLCDSANIAVFCAYHQYPFYWKYLDDYYDTFIPWYYCKTNPAPSIRKSSFRQGVEIICYAWNKGHFWNFQTQQEMLNWKSFPICMGNERVKNNEGKTFHPTQKRLDLCKFHVNIACPEGGIVFDPFAGTGSIGIAALDLNRRYVGVERDKTYFDKMVERFIEHDTQSKQSAKGIHKVRE